MNKRYQYKIYQPTTSTINNLVWTGDFEGVYRYDNARTWTQQWGLYNSGATIDRYTKDSYSGADSVNEVVLDGSSYGFYIYGFQAITASTGNPTPAKMGFMGWFSKTTWTDGKRADILNYYDAPNKKGFGIALNYTATYISALAGDGTTFFQAKVLLSTLTTGRHQIGMRVDGTNLSLIIDGAVVANTAMTNPISYGNPLSMGVGLGFSNSGGVSTVIPDTNYFDGSISQLCFYMDGTTSPSNTYFSNNYNDGSVQQSSSTNDLSMYFNLDDFTSSSSLFIYTYDKISGYQAYIRGTLATYSTFGTKTCVKIVTSTGGSATQGITISANKPAITGGQTYTASAWVKGTASHIANIQITPVGGGSPSSTSLTLTGAWQRIAVVGYVSNVSATNLAIDIFLSSASASIKTFYVDGVMLELGSTVHDFFTGDFATTSASIYTRNTTGSYHTAILKSFTYLDDVTDYISNTPDIIQEINTAGSEVMLSLAKPTNSFGEGTTIAFNNQIVVTVVSDYYPTGQIIYKGKIVNYKPIYTSPEHIEIVTHGYGSDLNDYILEGSNSISINQPIIDSYISLAIIYTGMPTTGIFFGQSFTTIAGQYYIHSIDVYMGSLVGTQSTRLYLWDSYTAASSISSYYGTYLPIAIASQTNYTTVAGWTRFTFRNTQNTADQPVVVSASTQYFFSIPIADTGADDTLVYGSYSNPYSDGYSFANTFVDLGTYTVIAGFDMAFRVNVPYGGTTTVYNSYDPSNMLKEALDNYNIQGGVLSYDSSTIDLTGSVSSYTFTGNTLYEVLQKVLELCPPGWYFYIDQATNKVHLHYSSSQVHTFILGQHFTSLEFDKRIQDVVNVIYYTGGINPDGSGNNIYKKYTSQSSVDLYGKKVTKMQDSRVLLTTTMDLLANTFLNVNNAPEIRTNMDVADGTYNLELVKPGDTVKLRGYGLNGGSSSLWDYGYWDSLYWDFDVLNPDTYEFQIARFDYKADGINLDLSTTPPDVNKRVEDIKRNLDVTQTINNPTAPLS